MNLLMSLVAGALLLTAQHPEMPPGMSHEEHLKQMQKDEALEKRGAEAMGFGPEATTHHFRLTPTGGSIEVTVKNPADDKNLSAIRGHLRSIADEFARGQFDRPFQTHGEIPPGVAAMQANAGKISYQYGDISDGGAVRIETSDPGLIQAVYAFIRYQITEHHTGDPLEVKR